MDLNSFVQDNEHRNKVQTIFKRGVRVIYQDALSDLMSNTKLIDKLLDMETIPAEVTTDFLRRLDEAELLEPEDSEELEEKQSQTQLGQVKIIKGYDSWEPVTPRSFHQHFVSRFKTLSKYLYRRPQLKNTVSIAHLSRSKTRDELSIIGMVRDIRDSKDGRRFIDLEDTSGSIRVIIPAHIREKGEIVPDEVIGIKGKPGRGIFFANTIVFPEIKPMSWPQADRPKALFLSDIHIGSNKFIEEIWDNTVSWLREHQDVRYLFIAGDVVDGIGVYAHQNENLEIDTHDAQFEALAKYLRQIPQRVQVFIISGNHDPNRDAEPQPVFSDDMARPLLKMKNVHMHSNPCWLDVEGVKILMYHGTSMDGLIDSIEPIRNRAYQEPHLAQKHLLKKRHLSPIFGRNKIFPDRGDFMIVNETPHVFHTGHVHTCSLGNYRGVRLVASGTFQGTTDFQEKIGHTPSPGKFIVMDLSDGSATPIDLANLN